jgi:hypothetical protein
MDLQQLANLIPTGRATLRLAAIVTMAAAMSWAASTAPLFAQVEARISATFNSVIPNSAALAVFYLSMSALVVAAIEHFVVDPLTRLGVARRVTKENLASQTARADDIRALRTEEKFVLRTFVDQQRQDLGGAEILHWVGTYRGPGVPNNPLLIEQATTALVRQGFLRISLPGGAYTVTHYFIVNDAYDFLTPRPELVHSSAAPRNVPRLVPAYQQSTAGRSPK